MMCSRALCNWNHQHLQHVTLAEADGAAMGLTRMTTCGFLIIITMIHYNKDLVVTFLNSIEEYKLYFVHFKIVLNIFE